MAEEQNCLTFSLTETIRFQQGQEVKELLSISLEPNVSCHEFDQYVILQGTLDCVGEYYPCMGDEELETDFNHIHKTAKVTLLNEEGIYSFSYSFPIDITVPADRCREGEELTLDIPSFEYKIQAEDCIEVSCELCVHGVYDRNFLIQEKAKQQEEELEEQEEAVAASDIQYGYGEQDFQMPDGDHAQPFSDPSFAEAVDPTASLQDDMRQSLERDQDSYSQPGYQSYYSHPIFGEQQWQDNASYQWSEPEVGDVYPNTPNFQESSSSEEQATVNYLNSEDFQQPFFQKNLNPWQPTASVPPINMQQPFDQSARNAAPSFELPAYQAPPIDSFARTESVQDQVEYPASEAIEYTSQGPFDYAAQDPNYGQSTMDYGAFDGSTYYANQNQEPFASEEPAFIDPFSYQERDPQDFVGNGFAENHPIYSEENPVAYPQEEPLGFGDLQNSSNFRVNVQGKREDTGYKSIFHAELESAFESDVSQPTFEDDLTDYTKLASEDGPSLEEQLEEQAVMQYRDEDEPDLEQTYEQIIYPFENEPRELADDEFYVEVKREPMEYELALDSPEAEREDQLNIGENLKQNEYTSSLFDVFDTREERTASLKICIVQRGDSFEKIAQRYSISPHKIARYNDLQPNATLEEGMVIYIPE